MANGTGETGTQSLVLFVPLVLLFLLLFTTALLSFHATKTRKISIFRVYSFSFFFYFLFFIYFFFFGLFVFLVPSIDALGLGR